MLCQSPSVLQKANSVHIPTLKTVLTAHTDNMFLTLKERYRFSWWITNYFDLHFSKYWKNHCKEPLSFPTQKNTHSYVDKTKLRCGHIGWSKKFMKKWTLVDLGGHLMWSVVMMLWWCYDVGWGGGYDRSGCASSIGSSWCCGWSGGQNIWFDLVGLTFGHMEVGLVIEWGHI